MINALKNNMEMLETAFYYPKNDVSIVPKRFKCAIVTEKERQFNTIIANLITEMGSMVIKTNQHQDFKILGVVKFRNKMYSIKNIGERELEVNMQVLSILKENPNKQYILELVELK